MTTQPPLPNPAAATPPPPPCTDGWRAKLLDFSGRNRSLFYKPVSSSLTLYMPERALWQQLTTEDASLPFHETIVTHPNLLTATPRDEAAISSSNAAAEKKLRSLLASYRTFLEEQGVHVLHVPVGWLTWTDDTRPALASDKQVTLSTGKNARLVRSPLLFLPVTLEHSARGWRILRQESEAIEPNLTILNYLKQAFDIAIDFDDEEDTILDACLTAYRDAIQDREHWSVDLGETALLDTFSFKKIAMLRELERSYDLIGAHPVLKALCGDGADLEALTTNIEHAPLDEKVKPDDVALAVPADSSQMRAVLAVNDGNSLVIQGPPGTGKSQTITNLISAATARGKSVLFVAEKKAARDVVVSNLEKAGLDDLVLHITEEVVTGRTARAKQAIADQLQALLEKGPGQYPLDARAPKAVADARGHLNAYVDALHKPLSPLSISSPFQLFHAWATAKRDLAPADLELDLPSVKEIDDGWLQGIRDVADGLDDLGNDVLAKASGPWLQMTAEGVALTDTKRLEEALPILSDLQEQLLALVDSLGLEEDDWNVPKVMALKQLLTDIEGYQNQQGNVLRFFMPSYWHDRSVARTHLRRGGVLPRDATGAARKLSADVDAWQDALDYVDNLYPFAFQTVDDVARLATDLEMALDGFRPAQLVLRNVDRSGLDDSDKEVLIALIDSGLGDASLRDVLDAVLKKHWAEEALQSSTEFATGANAHDRLRQRFNDSDLALREYARAQSLNAFAPHRPGLDTVAPRESELGILRAQVAARRRKPLRWLFSRAPSAILRLKPCIVASPLAVAQFLANRAYTFDLVIFDEASQVPTADAVVAMSRGSQVIVVGDSQQMPPTGFFDRILGDEDQPDDDFTFESVLQECEALLPARRLLWHYRSQDERLIAFSDQLFYNGSLRTFPSSWADHPDRGVHFEFVEGALYGRGGSRSNPDEALRVVSLLSKELTEHPENESAVTAMSVAQGEEVQTRIEAAAQTDAALAAWLEDGNRVKNLETVQGDECDVMFLSFGYGKDAAGNLTLNFGPLSRDDGYRRLNVAVTRARLKTVLVTSIKAGDIPTTVGAGGQLVRKYLDYAERGPIVLTENLVASGTLRYESAFEEDVANKLRALGWSVQTQVGVGSYRIDLAIVDPRQPGRYLAGVECDGATYHSAESARDRDIVRQQVLERLGWKILRVWSPDYFRNADEVVTKLHADIQALMRNPDVPATPAVAPTTSDMVSTPAPTSLEEPVAAQHAGREGFDAGTEEPTSAAQPRDITDDDTAEWPTTPADLPAVAYPPANGSQPIDDYYAAEDEEPYDDYPATVRQQSAGMVDLQPQLAWQHDPSQLDQGDDPLTSDPRPAQHAEPTSPQQQREWLPDPRPQSQDDDDRPSILAAPIRFGSAPPPAQPATPRNTQPPADDDFQPIDDSLPAGTVAYRPHVPTAPDRALERWIAQIVAREGPMHEDELLAALRDDLQGSTSAIPVRTQIERGLAESVRNVLVRRRNSFYYPPKFDALTLPVRINRGSERRVFRHYADEEVVRAIAIACREAGRLTRAQLPEATARLLDFNLTSTVRLRVDALVDAAVTAGLLATTGGYYEATPKA